MMMDRVRGVLRQLRVFVDRDAVDHEMDEELAFHIEMETRNNVKRGMSPSDARRAATLAFNGVERTKELVREGRWTRIVEETATDIRLGARSLMRTPMFTTIALLTLAIGIGANAALFAVLNALLFRSPAGMDATNVVWVDNRTAMRKLSYPDFVDLRAAGARALDLAAFFDADVGIAVGDGDAMRATAYLVSANYFDVLGARPPMGRGFFAEEEAVGGRSGVAVISDGMWRRVFNGDRAAVGSVIRVNGRQVTVVGVAPPKFAGADLESGADLWLPIGAQPIAMPRIYDVLGSRGHTVVTAVGRLRAGTDAVAAQSLMRAASRNLPRETEASPTPEFDVSAALRKAAPRPVLTLYPMRGWMRQGSFKEMQRALAAGWIITGLLLLIVCANIANLLLSRSAVRQREFGVRAALGARRARLVRLLTTEALVLSFSALVPALLLAFQGARLFERTFLNPIAPIHASIDARMLLFSIGAAILSAVIFGLAPALRFSRPDVIGILKGGGNGGLQRTRTQRIFVVAQVSLSMVLLLAGALFMRLLHESRSARLGFDPGHVAVATFDAYTRGLKPVQMDQLFDRMKTAVARIPGVSAASAPTYAPFKGGAMSMSVVPTERRADSTAAVHATGMGVSPGYFDVLSIRLLRGRLLAAGDEPASAPRAAVISELLARRIWGSQNPIGRTLTLDESNDPTTVVGVVADTRDVSLSGELEPQVYVPYNHSLHLAESHLLVRTSRDPASLLPDIRRAIHGVDPDLALFDMQTMRAAIGEEMSVISRLAILIASFGVVAVFLAGIGLYGIVAFSVLGRTREIGVRVALGARRSDVVMGFVREGVALTCIGLLAGSALAYAFGRLLASLVEELHPTDPLALAAVTITLMTISVAASMIPALRAGRVDAMTSLRAE
jgi:predicted permease